MNEPSNELGALAWVNSATEKVPQMLDANAAETQNS